jgi:hypothetical protein
VARKYTQAWTVQTADRSNRGWWRCSDPVGHEHIERALTTAGRSCKEFDFLCDSGSLQQLLATPYEPDCEWEMTVHIRGEASDAEHPLCILLEGCPAPLDRIAPDGIDEEDWLRWGRNFKRVCSDGVMAKQHAILRAKLGGMRCAIATHRMCSDKTGPLLLPLAPVPAPSQPAGVAQEEPEADEERRTQLYRSKTLLHCWIECFLTGINLALIGQCATNEGGGALHKLRPTLPREMCAALPAWVRWPGF